MKGRNTAKGRHTVEEERGTVEAGRGIEEEGRGRRERECRRSRTNVNLIRERMFKGKINVMKTTSGKNG